MSPVLTEIFPNRNPRLSTALNNYLPLFPEIVWLTLRKKWSLALLSLLNLMVPNGTSSSAQRTVFWPLLPSTIACGSQQWGQKSQELLCVGQMPEGMCEGVRSHTANQCLGCWITVDEALQLSLPNSLSKSCTCSRLCRQPPCTSISWLASSLSSIPATVDSTESFRLNYPLSLLPAKAQWVSSRTFLPKCSI